MNPKELVNDLKKRVEDISATENPPGVGYYGSELDETEVAEAGDHMREKAQTDYQPVPDPDPRLTNTTDR